MFCHKSLKRSSKHTSVAIFIPSISIVCISSVLPETKNFSSFPSGNSLAFGREWTRVPL